jgi:hypothetical protein
MLKRGNKKFQNLTSCKEENKTKEKKTECF